jgi:hypothetical protein
VALAVPDIQTSTKCEVDDAAGERHLVPVELAMGVDQFARRRRAARQRPLGVRPQADHDQREDRQDDRHDQVEDPGRDQVDGQRAEDRAGDPGGREAQPGSIVDPPQSRVGDRAGERVEETTSRLIEASWGRASGSSRRPAGPE